MKQEGYIIKIDKPCSQDWSSMRKIDAGKFCSYCSMSVLDFTQFTDEQMINFIQHRSGKVCGRLTSQQLNRHIEINEPEHNSRFRKLIAGLLVLGATKNAIATTKLPSQFNLVSVSQNNSNRLEHLISQKEPVTDSLKNCVQGKVIDAQTKEPLPYVSITIKDSKTGVMTNIDGVFKLVIPDSLVTEKICLVITYIGYEKTELVINKNSLPIIEDLLITPIEQVLMGEIIIIKKKKWWQFWKRN